jgi:hypothetical protein
MHAMTETKIDPRLVNTDISGNWSGVLIVDSEYGRKIKTALSHADLEASFSCANGKLSGTLVVKYQDSYDPPSFSKAIPLSGECGAATASTKITLPLKKYLGEQFFQKDVAIVFDRTIGSHSANAEVTYLEIQEYLGGIRLERP